MQDFLQALAKRLSQLFEEKWPVYLGRLWQGEKTPCFYLPPPELQRRLLPCGRVRREIALELHFYADKQPKLGKSGEPVRNSELSRSGEQRQSGELVRNAALSREQVAEKLLRGLAAFAGEQRAYRGWDLRCDVAGSGASQPGREYLRLRGRYVFYTTLELEAADGLSDWPEAAELMSYFNIINNEVKEEE